MRYLCLGFVFIFALACEEDYKRSNPISKVLIEPVYEDLTLSVRALDVNEEYVFYGSADHIGKHALNAQFKIDLDELNYSNGKSHFKHNFYQEEKPLHFRAIKQVNGNLFAISIENPARMYKLSRKSTKPKLVYEEVHEKVFYDALNFWNAQEGIAIGDPTEDCLSIIITRDAGETWTKLSCDDLPKIKEGEAAFAASNTNIAIVGNHTWVATGGMASRVFHSPDKGRTWEVFETPIIQGKQTTGIYSIDFFDEMNGFAIGGDYTQATANVANKISTTDGGKTWQKMADGNNPGYRSCVQYIPNSDGQELIAVGFNGIDYSNTAGESWSHISDEAFYTLKFVNDSIAYAAGKGRISKLRFR